MRMFDPMLAPALLIIGIMELAIGLCVFAGLLGTTTDWRTAFASLSVSMGLLCLIYFVHETVEFCHSEEQKLIRYSRKIKLTGYCPNCGVLVCEKEEGPDGILHVWCPMCEHGYEIRDLGLMPLGLEEEEEE